MRKNKLPGRRSGSYEVGWGRPPSATRFKPGQSGNPKGRPRGTKSLAMLFNEVMQQKMEIKEKGKVRKISVWEAVVRTLRNNALKGDFKAISFLLANEPKIAQQTPSLAAPPNMSSHELAKFYREFLKIGRS